MIDFCFFVFRRSFRAIVIYVVYYLRLATVQFHRRLYFLFLVGPINVCREQCGTVCTGANIRQRANEFSCVLHFIDKSQLLLFLTRLDSAPFSPSERDTYRACTGSSYMLRLITLLRIFIISQKNIK